MVEKLEHEGRIGKLEGMAEQMDKRLANLERGQHWIIGIQIAMFTVLANLGLQILTAVSKIQ